MKDITRDNLLTLIQDGAKREGLSISALERISGVPKDTLRDFLRAKTQILRADKLEKVLRILEPEVELTVSGTVGKNAEITPLSEKEKKSGAELVPCPPGFEPSEVTAVRVNGDAMKPVFQDGWIIYYTRKAKIPSIVTNGGMQVPYNKPAPKGSGRFAEFMGKPCVVQLKDGSQMLRTLKKGSKPKRYHLISYNAPDIKDADIAWAAKIVFIKVE